jgi:hypothetical protein
MARAARTGYAITLTSLATPITNFATETVAPVVSVVTANVVVTAPPVLLDWELSG